MKLRGGLEYALSCFLLLVPILLWNVFLAGSLPRGYSVEVFWNDIPQAVGLPENFLRVLVFALPLLMPLRVKTKRQRLGLVIYLTGVAFYFMSWVMQIRAPTSTWSSSALGFTAPAYTTAIWLVGIGLIGDRLFLRFPYRPTLYITIAMAFVAIHTAHAHIVYTRL